MKTSAWLALPLLVLATLSSCNQKPQLVKKGCTTDADCPTGQLCADGECVSMANFRCKATPVDGGMAGATGILQPSPHVVDFGVTGSDAVSKIITLRNIGSCALTVFDATLKGDQGSPFTCDGCGDKVFPLEIFPSGEQSSREKTVTLSFTAPKVGSFSDTLTLLSDDPEFPELKVPVRARFDGVPKLTASPDPVKFGYVAAGADMTRAVQLANHGTGVAAINLTGIRLDPETSATFTLEDSVDHPLPTKDLPVKLVPTGVDPRASYLFTLHYHPRDSSDDQVDVVIDTDSDQVGTIRLTASGTSQTPPALSIDPSTVTSRTCPWGR